MRRRSYLAGLGVTAATALAGCASDTDSGNGNGNGDTDSPDNSSNESDENAASLPEQPTITAEDTNPDDVVTTLEIRWNATVFDTFEIDPDRSQYFDSSDGEQYLIFQTEITNTGEETAHFVPGQMEVLADGTEAEWTVVDDGSKLNVNLEPEESADGWVVFTIPEDTNEVVITIQDSSIIEYAAEFTHDEEMDVDVVPA